MDRGRETRAIRVRSGEMKNIMIMTPTRVTILVTVSVMASWRVIAIASTSLVIRERVSPNSWVSK